MNTFLNVIIMFLETFYYSIFMKSVKNDGKLIRYFCAFLIVSVLGVFIGNNNLFSYLVLILMMTYSIKLIVRVKTTLFDVLVIFGMLLIKIFIELLFAFLIYIFTNNPFVIATILGLLKLVFLLLLKNKLHKIYKTLEKQWNENRFGIRYIFSVLMFIYVIISCLFLILNF